MTVLQIWEDPVALMEDSALTKLGATAATVSQALQASAVRGILMSAFPTLVALMVA